jgi:hypothetical protein
MKKRLPTSLFALLLVWGSGLPAGEARYDLADGRFSFAVPSAWLHIGGQLEGPRQFHGFMVPWADAAATPGNLSVLSFCQESPAKAVEYIDELKEEARGQDGFKPEAATAVGRFDSMRYGAKQGRETFAIGDYYLQADRCGIQLRFAVPLGQQEGFADATQAVLDSLQVK